MDNETIFHYTNLQAFKNIIETGEIWFTRIDCLNDFSEFIYYKDIFNKARTEFISEQRINGKYDLGLINMWADDKFINVRDDYLKKTFTFSLSKLGDSIPMWNYYADKTGITIGFNKELFINALKERINTYYSISAYNIEYNLGKQLELVKSSLNEILKLAND